MVFLVGSALVCVVWAVVAGFLIARDLEKRGTQVSFLWLRLMILKHVYEYSKITREETGRVGPLFYHYVVRLNVALLLAIVIIIVARS